MKNNLIKTQNLIIAFFLTLLGFGTACSKDSETPGIEYGVPRATFKVFGKITSESGIKIPAIRVIMKSENVYSYNDTVISDYYGNYEVSLSEFPTDHDFEMEFEDIDGAAHASYKKKDTTAKFVNPVFEGGESWNRGETSKELNIKLKEQ